MPEYLGEPPLAFAHRGGSATDGNVGIENSVAAFARAYETGYRYFETDVRASFDGVVYAVHDETLHRLTGSTDAVASLTAESLDQQRLDNREPLARLETLYEQFPDARLNIDLKSDDVIEAACTLIEHHAVAAQTLLASFSHRRLRRVRRRLPEVATSASSLEVAAVKLLPLAILRGLRFAPVCLQVPAKRGPLQVVTKRLLRRAHALDLQVHVWTVDDFTEMNRLFDLGVDGIITDRIDVLAEVLAGRGTPLSGEDNP